MKGSTAKRIQGKAAAPVGDVIENLVARKSRARARPGVKQVESAAKVFVAGGKPKVALGDVKRSSSRRSRADDGDLKSLVKGSARLNMLDFRALYQSLPEQRIALIRAGIVPLK